MKVKILVGISVIITILYGCSQNNKNSYSGIDIDSADDIEEDVEEDAVAYDPEQYFIPNSDGHVYMTNDDYLRQLYSYNYMREYAIYQDFRNAALDRRINLDYKTIQNSVQFGPVDFYYYDAKFVPDNSIMQIYREQGMQPIISLYCKRGKMQKLFFSDEFKGSAMDNENRRLTIAYCLWLNGYEYVWDNCFGAECFILDLERWARRFWDRGSGGRFFAVAKRAELERS